MISTDAKILEEGSSVRARMQDYGKLFSSLHIVLFVKKSTHAVTSLSENVTVYPTNSTSKFFHIRDGKKIGEDIISSRAFTAHDTIITTQDPFEAGIVGLYLSETTGIKLHVQVHTDLGSIFFADGFLNKIRILFSKKTLRKAHAIRTVSARIKTSLSPKLQHKASILPIFADLASIATAPITIDLAKKYPQFKKIALIASRFTKEKDIYTALRAFNIVHKSYADSGLVIVGSGPLLPEIMTKVQGFKGAVILEDWADQKTLISYMKTCDVFVSSSLYEGYGLSMLEAHAAGALLVATNAGIAPLLTSEECLVEPGDLHGLAEALKKAFSCLVRNKDYKYPYTSKQAYLEAFKADIERTLLYLSHE